MKIELTKGDSPLVLAQPHGGTEIPDAIFSRLSAIGQAKEDTDWHITRLYEGLIEQATVVSTPIHRYVIDANRDPSGKSLYPGQYTTGLCPTSTFDDRSLYVEGQAPSLDEVTDRQRQYHQPYHDAIREQLERVHQRHGYVVLYDCHSIRSVVPCLFDGKLPDLNIGTNDGTSCSHKITLAIENICEASSQYSHISNGRFKGGWTTRHYGKPDTGYHAIQMELSQCNYMQETNPWHYETAKAQHLRALLKDILENCLEM
ncbi:MAG: N-formylglutamate deformylase [Gammaproteobacteria bacterium]|jgi:formiminoglutamase